MKIVFLGTPEFALNSLNMLIDSGHDVLAVVCQPDRVGNRGRVTQCAVKEFAIQKGLSVLQFDSVSRDGIDALKALEPDLIVTCAFGQLLSEEFLCIAPMGVVNVHASLLPRYRGASPINSVLLNGERITGVTIMRTVKKMDAGDVVLSRSIDIGENENFGELSARLSALGAELLDEALTLLERGEASFVPQDEAKATSCGKITKETEKIDFSRPVSEVFNQIRALSPVPGAFAFFNGRRLKIFSAKIMDNLFLDGAPGVLCLRDNGLFVKTGDNKALQLIELQPENGRRMDAASFCNGRKIDGSVLV